MSDDRAAALRSILDRTYSPDEYPTLTWQTQQWQMASPFKGMRVLDATPVYENTFAKYLPLIAGGADLTVSLSPLLPHDVDAVQVLEHIGIPVVHPPSPSQEFDVVMDCAGVLSKVAARTGYVELTKSGQRIYATSAKPVFLVDDSRVKLIETSLGTGDGLVRGLAECGYSDLRGRTMVIFGCGKVGRGAALQARKAGADVIVIDSDPRAPVPAGCGLVDAGDNEAVHASLAAASFVVSATGTPGALEPVTGPLISSDAVLANLGAEDEFGPTMPTDRVLNEKVAVNFALAEPTRLRYMDATMALDNACALELLTGTHPAGINRPPRALEDAILEVARSASTIDDELSQIEEELRA